VQILKKNVGPQQVLEDFGADRQVEGRASHRELDGVAVEVVEDVAGRVEVHRLPAHARIGQDVGEGMVAGADLQDRTGMAGADQLGGDGEPVAVIEVMPLHGKAPGGRGQAPCG